MAAAASSLESRVDNITTCTICFDDFESPRCLPCGHSFCLKCLEGHCREKRPGENARCPLCNREFAIPRNGLGEFHVNLALQDLVDAKHITGTEAEPCEVCSTKQNYVAATVSCDDCDGQKLCERCSLPHKRMKRGPHQIRLLGAATILELEEGDARVIKNISLDVAVNGMTFLNGKLYVLLGRRDNHIAIYSNNNQLLRHLHLPGYKPDDHSDMTSCELHKCLYMSDWYNSCIHRYDLDSRATSKWSVPGKPCGVSITLSCNLLVTCQRPNQLVELSADSGQSVCEIALQSDIEAPHHAVQLTTGQYVVSHGGLGGLHRVCIVDDAGKVTRCYGEKLGSDVGQLNLPYHLACDKDSRYIVDGGNNRVVLLSPTLEFVGYITEGMSEPRRLYLHLTTRRMFVGHGGYSSGVTVIQM